MIYSAESGDTSLSGRQWRTNIAFNKIAFQYDAYRPLVDRIPECTAQGDGGVCPGCVCLGVPAQTPPVNRMTDRCKNITCRPSLGAVKAFNKSRAKQHSTVAAVIASSRSSTNTPAQN